MLYLKEANTEDVEKEYEFITNTPENENGFINENHGCTREEFENRAILYHLLLDTQRFLLMKQEFVQSLTEEQVNIYWNVEKKKS